MRKFQAQYLILLLLILLDSTRSYLSHHGWLAGPDLFQTIPTITLFSHGTHFFEGAWPTISLELSINEYPWRITGASN